MFDSTPWYMFLLVPAAWAAWLALAPFVVTGVLFSRLVPK